MTDHPLPPVPGRSHAWPLMLPAIAAWACALILLGCSARTGVIVALAAALGAVAVAWHTRSLPGRRDGRSTSGPATWRGVALAGLVCAAAASGSVAFRVHAVTTGPVAELAERNASVIARIVLTDDPRRRSSRSIPYAPDSYVTPATLTIIRTAGVRQAVNVPVIVFSSGAAWARLLPSQHLEVTGRLASPTSGDLVAAVLLVRGPPRVLTPPSKLQTVAGALRSGLRSAADVLPPDQRGLLPGLVVGDVSRMDPQVTADFKEAGLSHLNAVSGANLAIVAGAMLALSRLFGFPLPVRAVLAALSMLAFAVVARPSPSVLRALLMGLAAAVALGTGRARDGFAALSATVLLLVLFVPELARSYGFALSVAATAGILLLAPRWRDRLSATQEDESDAPPQGPSAGPRPHPSGAPLPETGGGPGRDRRDPHGLDQGGGPGPDAGNGSGAPGRGRAQPRSPVRLPRWLAEAIAVPAAAQVAVTPVLVLMSGQLTPVALIANLLAAPAVAPATLLGFGAALVAPVWLDGARLLVVPAGYAVGWIIMVARWSVGLPYATVPWPGGLPGLGLLALAVAVGTLILRRRAWRAIVLTAAGAALVAVLVIRPIATPWPPDGWLMVMCDVGQGDGIVVAAGPGRGVVVDTGPDPVAMDRCLRGLGVDDVPLLVLTHPHADHVGGLPGVLRDRRVGAVVVSPQRALARASARVSGTLEGRRIPEWTVSPGTRWTFGPSEVTVLAPDPASGEVAGQGEGSAINNSSVVLHVRWRSGSVLLSGDLETEAQEEVLRRSTVRADILKIPHHGSNRQSPAFLEAVGARAALISVGADNDYGHPAPSTLALLRRLGAAVYRTDHSGDLAVVEREGGMAVISRGRAP
ncbi:ComEC/Rec2 family competence protein [Nonomuraea deserti]|uniref:ComEC/Rec2 family competence protein n=1 Tax=Nonomuraea deserti TaxID=1848322 RepID=UPI001FE74E2B|nr:ComEC/Rec2 family competence protein [Nonomuraea deserti]